MAGLLAALPSPPTHKSHPDTCRGKLDEREIVGVVLCEARGDSSEVLELVEEALHEIAEAVEKGAEMDADRGAVDHLQVAVVRLGNSVVNAIPDAELAPPHKAVVAGRCRPIALGNVGPWRARAQPPIDAVQDGAVVRPRHAAGLVRKH